MKALLDLPAGFRFHPTDEELVLQYLIRKCSSQSIGVPIIADIDLYKFDPWDLPGMALYGEKEWYFFSPRDRKYPNGSRPSRSAGTGYWKATGADKPIGRPTTLGIKKALVFYAGKAPKGVKTNWIMHEYRLANVDRSAGKTKNLRLDDWVLCRIYNKKGTIEKCYSHSVKPEQFPEIETKAGILAPTRNPHTPPQHGHSAMFAGHMHMDSSEPFQMMHFQAESSCSEHVLSPEFASDKEVQSSSQWGDDLDGALDFQFSSMDNLGGFLGDPFGTQVQFQTDQISPLEDMFTYLQKPF